MRFPGLPKRMLLAGGKDGKDGGAGAAFSRPPRTRFAGRREFGGGGGGGGGRRKAFKEREGVFSGALCLQARGGKGGMRFPGLPKCMLLAGGKEGGDGAAFSSFACRRGGGGGNAFSRPGGKEGGGLQAGKGGMHLACRWGEAVVCVLQAFSIAFACRREWARRNVVSTGLQVGKGGRMRRKRQLFNRLWPGRIVQLRGVLQLRFGIWIVQLRGGLFI